MFVVNVNLMVMTELKTERRPSKSSIYLLSPSYHADRSNPFSVKKYFRSSELKSRGRSNSIPADTTTNNNNNNNNPLQSKLPELSRSSDESPFDDKTSAHRNSTPPPTPRSSSQVDNNPRLSPWFVSVPPPPQPGSRLSPRAVDSPISSNEPVTEPRSPSPGSLPGKVFGKPVRKPIPKPLPLLPPSPHGSSRSSSPEFIYTPSNSPSSISDWVSELTSDMSSNNRRPSSSKGEKPSLASLQSQNESQTPSSSTAQPQVAQNSTSGPTNLSGLVCNVHRTTGREPPALVGATTTILGDKLYVFGGRALSRNRAELTSDLYELDLIKRHWTKLRTTGDIPPPRYFHSMCALGDTKLVCYGGMSPRSAVAGHPSASVSSSQQGGQDSQPEVVVMSDVHIYDVLHRNWTRINTANTPQGRYAHCAAILPSSAPFASVNAPMSAIHNNPSTSNPHQGSIGVAIDGVGGAEMVVVGGQDSSNHYIEQISVFNLRSLKWTATSPLGRSCGAYRSVVVPLSDFPVSDIGAGNETRGSRTESDTCGSAMVIYSNYNFLDVKLELQVRLPNGQLVEKRMDTSVSPPGLRFPNGGVINGHFVVSGTYLTSSKQEYALWALDLKTMTWGRIDVGGAIFSHGSWNRGILWNRRSTFVILGHRKRSLVEDYNHRRINFSHICMVELEAFGLYDNPRKTSPTSGYMSVSAPILPQSLQSKFHIQSFGGRSMSATAEKLGHLAHSLPELSDMELLTIGGERIPVSSHVLSRRWGPYFNQLLREATNVANDNSSDAATIRRANTTTNSRNSSITITPSITNSNSYSNSSTLINQPPNQIGRTGSIQPSDLETPSAQSLTPSRPRMLYLPHTYLTVQLLVHYLYTSSLPSISSPLCTPQILCSLLQVARPYQIDGLLEATVERLHQVLDGRNAAAVFNAAAMAAGGGRGTGFTNGLGGTLEVLNGTNSTTTELRSASVASDRNDNSVFYDGDPGTTDRPGSENGHPLPFRRRESSTSSMPRPSNLRINTNVNSTAFNRNRAESVDSLSTATSASTNNSSFSFADAEFKGGKRERREVWSADLSSVAGLQKRGLRGLMEGRRMRERGVMKNNSIDDRGGSGQGGQGQPGGPGPSQNGNNPSSTATSSRTVGVKTGLGIS